MPCRKKLPDWQTDNKQTHILRPNGCYGTESNRDKVQCLQTNEIQRNEKSYHHTDPGILPLDSHVLALDSPAYPVLVDDDWLCFDSLRFVHLVQSWLETQDSLECHEYPFRHRHSRGSMGHLLARRQDFLLAFRFCPTAGECHLRNEIRGIALAIISLDAVADRTGRGNLLERLRATDAFPTLGSQCRICRNHASVRGGPCGFAQFHAYHGSLGSWHRLGDALPFLSGSFLGHHPLARTLGRGCLHLVPDLTNRLQGKVDATNTALDASLDSPARQMTR